jgi:catechol 2,3-dioxygenase-like lactoylglutathione lyase family enzyme
LKAKGVKFSGKPVKFSEGPDKGNTIAYAADPDGITVELIQPPSDNLE